MHTLAAREAFKPASCVDDARGVGVGLVHLAEIRVALDGAVDRGLWVVAHELGDALAFPYGKAQHTRRVVDGVFGLELAVGDHVRDALVAVDLAAVLDHVQTPAVVEVHVDIGHLGALRREEALEDEVVFQRVKGGDVKCVGDDGAGRRPAPRPHADAVFLCPARELLHDQKIGGKALRAYNLVLVLEALDHLGRQRVAVAHLQPLDGHLRQRLLRRLPLAQEGVARQDDVAKLYGDVALVGDFKRRGQALGMLAQRLGHLLVALQVELVVFELHARRVVHLLVHADAQHEVLQGGVLALQVVQIVCAHRLQAQLGGELAQQVV